MVTKVVEVTQTIEVTVDETKFDAESMAEFRDGMYPFVNIDDHIKHLAALEAQSYISHGAAFIEGYGPMNEMGIRVTTDGLETEIVSA